MAILNQDFVMIVDIGSQGIAPTGVNVGTVFLDQVQGKVALMGKENARGTIHGVAQGQLGQWMSIALQGVMRAWAIANNVIQERLIVVEMEEGSALTVDFGVV